MSRPRYIWWSYVQGMLRKYPERAAALGELHAVGLTARYGAQTGGGRGPGRTTEAVALRQLPAMEQKEYDAVRRALEHAGSLPDGALRLELVRLVYWDRTHRLYAAAREIGVSERTAKRWNAWLIRRVAVNYGLLDEKLALHGQNNVL